MPPSRHASAALLTFTLLGFASCATSPEHRALAKVGDREITAGQLQEYAESLPAAARQGLETDAALLEAFILHRLLLLEAETVAIQEAPEFKEAFSDFGKRELEAAVLELPIGTSEAGQLTVGNFISTVGAPDADVRRRLASRPSIASMVHGLIVNKIVDWEARSLGLHEESGYLAKVDAERRRLLVKHMLRESASTGRDYEEFVTGLRQKYSVEVFASYPAE